MQQSKGQYPWRIGATSFVIPATIEENVRFLADRVDDVQLLFFESPSQCPLPQKIDINLLQGLADEHDLSYTIHLPTDIQPGKRSAVIRQLAVDEIVRLVEELAPLEPRCYDLHLAWPPELEREQWLMHINDFLGRLKRDLQGTGAVIAIENTDYPFHHVRQVVLDHGFALCTDIGHGLLYGEQQQELFADIRRAVHIHYHGVRAGRDHLALEAEQQALSKRLGDVMQASGFTGVVTLEVYRSADLAASMQHIDEIWLDHQQQK